MPTIAARWRGGWILIATGTLQPGAVGPYERIYGLDPERNAVEIGTDSTVTLTVAQIIQQWESSSGNVLVPLAYNDVDREAARAARSLDPITSTISVIPLPKIYGGGGGGGDATSIQGRPVSAAAPNVNDGLIWDGAQWVPGVIVPTLALARFNGVDDSQFTGTAPTLIGAPVNPTLAFSAPTATSFEGSITLGLDELTPDGDGAVWWLDELVDVQPIVMSWLMAALDPGDGYRVGLVFGGDPTDGTWIAFCQQFNSIGPVSSFVVAAGNGATPEATLVVSDPSTIGSVNLMQVTLAAGLGDVASFPPQGVPRYAGTMQNAGNTFAADARLAVVSALGPVLAGAEWGTRPNNRVGVLLQAVGAVPVGGIRITLASMCWASNPNG